MLWGARFLFLTGFTLISTSVFAGAVELFGGENKCGRTVRLENLLNERGVSFTYRSWEDPASNQYMWSRLREITPEGQEIKTGISPGIIAGDKQVIIPMDSSWDDWQRYANEIASLAKSENLESNSATSHPNAVTVDSEKQAEYSQLSVPQDKRGFNAVDKQSGYGADGSIFALNRHDGSIWQWSGRPHVWTHVGSEAEAIAANGNSLYAINQKDSSVWFNSGSGWTHIGDRAADIAVDGTNIYIIDKQDHSIWKYNGSPQNWSKVGDRASKIAARNGGLWVINKDNASVWHNSGNGQWQHVGDRAKDIVVGSEGVFVLNNQDHSIWKYENAPHSWSHYGVRAKQLVQASGAVYVINQDNASVWKNEGSGWVHVGDRAQSISASETGVFVVNNENASIWLFNGKPHSWTHIGDRAEQIAVSK